MTQKILFVDDDAKLLKSFKRTMPKWFKVVTAEGPEEALHILKEGGPFPVIVSDMKMPGMDGIELLSRSKEISPDSARILLTGYADQQTAIDAVNKGDLFRFLTKPCDIDILSGILRDGVRQYQLLVSEKELLEQTLFGTVKVLSQVLALVNPAAQGLASRLKRSCRHIVKELNIEEESWLFEMATMLSQLGCLTIPQEILTKVSSGGSLTDEEEKMVGKHPSVAAKLLMHIPRMEEVTEIVALQDRPYSSFPEFVAADNYSKVHLGAQILHTAIGLDQLLMRGIAPAKALLRLQKAEKEFNPALLTALKSLDFGLQNMVQMNIKSSELNSRMILDEDLYTSKGMLLASKGQHINDALLAGVLNYSHTVGIKEPFAVLVPLLDYEM